MLDFLFTLRRRDTSKMADARQTRRQAGPAVLLKMTKNVISGSIPLPQVSLLTCVVILYLFFYLLRPHIISNSLNHIYLPAKRSQHLLFSRLFNLSRARTPSKKYKDLHFCSHLPGLAHLSAILLLAGDVEINPGPVTPNEPQQAPLAPPPGLTWPSQQPASFHQRTPASTTANLGIVPTADGSAAGDPPHQIASEQRTSGSVQPTSGY